MRERIEYVKVWATWKWRSASEGFVRRIAWRLPRKLVYWSAIRVMVQGYNGNPADRSCGEALKGWE